jgi:hypothetical protein
MLKFIKHIFIFLIFSSLAYIILIIIWGDFSPFRKNLNYRIGISGHSYTRLKELKKTKDIDLLFLGSSHAYRGFDNRIFSKAGYSSFIMGSNSQTPIQTEFLLNRYLDSLNPKFVIFEVCPFVFSLDGIEASLVIISNDKINFKNVELAFNQNHLLIYNTLIYALYRDFIHHDKDKYSEEKIRKNDTYINGGFVEKELLFYKSEKIDKQEWSYSKELFESLENIVKTLKDRNIELILVQAPVTHDLYNSYTNNNDFDKEMRKYGDYYNFNEILQLNDTVDFQDYHHLNRFGVEVFNKEILKIVTLNNEKYNQEKVK